MLHVRRATPLRPAKSQHSKHCLCPFFFYNEIDFGITKLWAKVMELEARNHIKNDYNTFFYATMCHVCKRFGDGVHLKRCGGCRMIAYCSQQHQKEHWKQHRSLCKAIQDVLRDYSIDNCGETPEEWNNIKLNFMLLVSFKLGRRLEFEEMQMFKFPRECLVCHERNDRSLEDCQKCAASFCKNHKNGIGHRDICAILELCLRSLLTMRKENRSCFHLKLSYLQHVSGTGTFQNMNDFIMTFGNIQTCSKMSYNILAAQHSLHLTRPLTLFHAMQLLKYEPKSKDLVIHVVGASDAEEATLMAWEVFPRLIETVMSVAIIMVGPELKREFNPLHICDNCTSREKKCLVFEFHDMLYENYVRSPLFVKPDLVVGFNLGIHEYELGSKEETWTSSIQMLAKQNRPFVLTCFVRQEIKEETDRISTILGGKVDYLYSGKNPFASLRPYRAFGPEHVFYTNLYILIYRSLNCS